MATPRFQARRGLARTGVNRTDPLSRGLVSWWTVLPAGVGRAWQWRDQCGRYHGTMSSGLSWVGHPRGLPSGWGAMKSSGSENNVTASGFPLLGAGETTVAIWFSADDVTANRTMFFTGTNSTAVGIACEVGRTSGKLSIFWRNASTSLTHTGTITVSGSAWYHAVFIRRGSTGSWTAETYINGNVDNTTSTAVNPDTTASPTTAIGYNPFVGGRSLFGYWNDVRVYNRALAAEEVRKLYAASLRNYPRGLKWLPQRPGLSVASTGGPIPRVLIVYPELLHEDIY